MICFCDCIDLLCRIQTAALHQFDVQNISCIHLAGFCCINRRMDRLIQHNLHINLLAKDLGTVHIPPWQTLLYCVNTDFFKFFQNSYRIIYGISLVCIHTQADIRSNCFTNQSKCTNIIRRINSSFHLQDTESITLNTLFCFLCHQFRLINTNCHIGYDLVTVSAQYLVQRLIHNLALQIIQRNIDCSLC